MAVPRPSLVALLSLVLLVLATFVPSAFAIGPAVLKPRLSATPALPARAVVAATAAIVGSASIAIDDG
ncbi:hypothetical protein DFJ73DRAFT_800457 [Zopfochytrium polystomum]|nr:hypothetical protein DFJ73DRAFT_800457 [Zopfochytrium polystomum]